MVSAKTKTGSVIQCLSIEVRDMLRWTSVDCLLFSHLSRA